MKTAIIDDNSREAEHLRQLLADYAADNKIDITISYFDCGEAFLDSSVRSKFDVIFLDIFMHGRDGIEVASKLWSAGDPGLVVFLTTSREHIWQAAALHSFDYILKDTLSAERLTELMNDICKKMHYSRQIIAFTAGSQEVRIPAASVQSIVAEANYTAFTFAGGTEMRYRIPFSRIAENVSTNCSFINCNRGIIINMDHIIKESSDGFEIENGTRYPIRKRDRTALKNRYHDYQFKKLEEL
jgi:Response regulator of the LytR/AlgR family